MRSTTFSKVIGVFAAAAFALGCLVGCNGAAKPKLSNPAELYEVYKQAKRDNFKTEGVLTLNVDVSSIDLSFDTAIKGESAGGNAHTLLTSKNGKSTMEVYLVKQSDDKYVMYFKGIPVDLSALGIDLASVLGDNWYVTDLSLNKEYADTLDADKVMTALLSEATFEKGDSTYIVTIPGSALSEQVAAVMAEQADESPEGAQVTAAVIDALKTTDLKLAFDHEGHLVGATMAPFTVNVDRQGSTAVMTTSVTCGFDLKFSDFGSVPEIAVPEDVVANAVSTEARADELVSME